MNKVTSLSVVGLGKLGACTAACFALRGFKVLGIDSDFRVIEKMRRHKAPVSEPGLEKSMKDAGQNLEVCTDYVRAIEDADATCIVVPTPSVEDGAFSCAMVEDTLRRLGKAFGDSRKPYHLFIIVSTVSPKTTEDILIPLLEKTSGKRCRGDFGVCYNPEFIALGSVIHDFLNPDLVLIGESDEVAGNLCAGIYKQLCMNTPFIARMPLISAEITKIALNAYVTMKISFANTITCICENIPGANIDKVTQALGADTRIGPRYLRGGVSYGGPCFPRDNRAFAEFATRFSASSRLAEATDAFNREYYDFICERILSLLKEKRLSRAAVFGLAYKPGTCVIEESASIKIIEGLLKNDIKVCVYDPMAMNAARRFFGGRVAYADSLDSCIARSDLGIIATADSAFSGLGAALHGTRSYVLFDCWRLLESSCLKEGIEYYALGKGTRTKR